MPGITAGAAGTAEETDRVFAEFQGNLNLIFARTRSLWKESAAYVHPDLQVTGYKLLTYIEHAGPANAHEIADRFEMDKSVVSRQVRMLEDLGLVESRADERDGRLRVLTATPRARSALAELRSGNASRVRGAIGGLSIDEIRTASKVFRMLAEA